MQFRLSAVQLGGDAIGAEYSTVRGSMFRWEDCASSPPPCKLHQVLLFFRVVLRMLSWWSWA